MSALGAPSNTPASAGGVAAIYYQCGGSNWTGPTQCEAGSYCKEQNPFYHQCVAVDDSTYPTATTSDVDYINTVISSGTPSARPTTMVTVITSSAATPTGAAEDDGDYCDDEGAASPTGASAPASAPAEDDGDYCEGEETATVVVAATPTASAAASGEGEDDYCEDAQ
ncbi:Cel74a [Diaporthe helianthi]|uniref:Cel74a n=1 Tax=Diaporthe helianthi TaxID=158607 RepID=A0A2P5I9R4_DIAHE|nr:Cel74a [Diaporthe helianthi]